MRCITSEKVSVILIKRCYSALNELTFEWLTRWLYVQTFKYFEDFDKLSFATSPYVSRLRKRNIYGSFMPTILTCNWMIDNCS